MSGLQLRNDGHDTSHWNRLTGQPLKQLPLHITKLSEGNNYVDPTGAAIVQAARNAGIRYIGGYHFVRDGSPEKQWENFNAQLKKSQIIERNGFYVFDWEKPKDAPAPSWATCKKIFQLARDAYPGRGLIYTANWVPNFSTWFAQHDREPLWYAEYFKQSEVDMYDPDLHQWSSTQAAQGFAGNIDTNIILKRQVLEDICGYTPVAVPASLPELPEEEFTDTLRGPAALYPNEELHSRNGIWTCRMQGDGNLVVLVYNKPVWNSHTSGNPGAELQLGPDGNVIVCLPNRIFWGTFTPTGADRLVMQDDGNLVTYKGDKATWSIWSGPIQ